MSRLYSPTVVKLESKPYRFAYHLYNDRVVQVPVWRGANIRYVKAEINRAKRGRDHLGRRKQLSLIDRLLGRK